MELRFVVSNFILLMLILMLLNEIIMFIEGLMRQLVKAFNIDGVLKIADFSKKIK